MGIFASLDAAVDRVLARLCGRRREGAVQPATIAREAAKAMELQRQVGIDALYVPNHFEVRLHPLDLAAVEPVRNTARRDAVRYLLRTANRRGYSFAGPVEVELVGDPQVTRGTVAVQATFREEALVDGGGETAALEATRVRGAVPGLEGETRLYTAVRQAEPRGREAWLEVQEEDGGVRRFPLGSKAEYAVGRSEENDLQLADGRVSRRHARLVFDGGAWWVEDLQTTNGTLKNGAPVRRERLQDGDELRMGRVVLRYVERPPRG